GRDSMDRGVSIQHFFRHCASFPAAYSSSGGSGKSPGGTEKPVCAFSDRKSRKEQIPGREDLWSGSVGRRHGDRRHGDPHSHSDPLVRRYPGSERSHGNAERKKPVSGYGVRLSQRSVLGSGRERGGGHHPELLPGIRAAFYPVLCFDGVSGEVL